MKKLLIAVAILIIILTNVYSFEISDTYVYLPSSEEVTKLYGKDFVESNVDFLPIYKNKVDYDGLKSSKLFVEKGTNNFIYILINYTKDADSALTTFFQNLERAFAASGKNKKAEKLNIGDKGFFMPGDMGVYGVKYGNFLIRVNCTNVFDGKKALVWILDKIVNKKNSNNVNLAKIKYLLINELYLPKSNIINKAGVKKIKVGIQLLNNYKEVYSSVKDCELNLKQELNSFNVTVKYPVNRKFLDILDKLNGGSFFVLSISGYKPLIINLDKQDFYLLSDHIEYRHDSSLSMDLFKEPVYCSKNGHIDESVLFNRKLGKYFWLVNSRTDYITIAEYDKKSGISKIRLINNKYKVKSPKLILDDKGDIVVIHGYKDELYTIIDNELEPIAKPNIIGEKNFDFDPYKYYLFKGELIREGEWLVPYYSSYNQINIIPPYSNYSYVRDYFCDKLKVVSCGYNTLKKEVLAKNLKFENSAQVYVYWKGRFEVKGDLKKKPRTEILSKRKTDTCSEEVTSIEYQCNSFKDYFNGIKVADVDMTTDDYRMECIEARDLPVNCEGNLFVPVNFGVKIKFCGLNKCIMNKYEGPYDEIRYCDNGVIKSKEIHHSGWITFEDQNQMNIKVKVNKVKYNEKEDNFFVSTKNAKRLVFHGRVISKDGKPIVDSTVSINGKSVKTDSDGRFEIIFDINKGSEVKEYDLEYTLYKKISGLNIELLSQEKIYPNGGYYKIKISALNDKKPLKNTEISIEKITSFYRKDGKQIFPSGFENGMFIGKKEETDDKGILTFSFKSPDFKGDGIKKFHNILFPIFAEIKVCETINHYCDSFKVIIDDPAPKIEVRIPSGIEEGVWQLKPSTIKIEDPDSKNFTIQIRAYGRLKTVGRDTITKKNEPLIYKTDKKFIEFYYEPLKFGDDLAGNLPNVLKMYLDTNLNVLLGFVGVGGSVLAEGGTKALTNIPDFKIKNLVIKTSILNKANINISNKETFLKYLYDSSTKGMSASMMGLTLGDMKEGVTTPDIVSITDWSIGFVDLIGGSFSNSITHSKAFKVKSLEKLGGATLKKFSKSGSLNKLIKVLKIDKLSKILGENSGLSGALSVELAKALWANAKTTYEIFNQYKQIAESYQDIIFVPVAISVTDESGYGTSVIRKVGVKINKLNNW
ncbi:hypothetical protein DEFDS_0793 [Deferribacter desulfuricans SSM1]|uniref:Uncharacterized protein n=1 Tax=Deferribacter desulfuricans (strain DSM 14783 / JCM 11476 / NBRC 101012 / SSM1) TaxID=639282 RepID=D3PCE8_DEFDS|nr:hypothetical protein [Deferribacter desulfuricans]BAI80271.1 hypothetical protein DEFDS_0793 [Deferribacter desulfuricans SSM1]